MLLRVALLARFNCPCRFVITQVPASVVRVLMVSAAKKDPAVETGKIRRLKAVMTAIRLTAMVALPDALPNRRNFSKTIS